jgi:hypothetical protein
VIVPFGDIVVVGVVEQLTLSLWSAEYIFKLNFDSVSISLFIYIYWV